MDGDEAKLMQDGYGLPAAVAARAINQDRPGFIQLAGLLPERGIPKRQVDRARQGTPAILRVRTHVENLRVRTGFKKCFRIAGMPVEALAPGFMLEQTPVPPALEPVPADNNERDDDERPDHDRKSGGGRSGLQRCELTANSSAMTAP